VFVWGTIDPGTASINLLTAPAVLVGMVVGLLTVKLIPEKPYRYFVLITTTIVTIRLFF
jgi:uncharacterized membrane protein YfcA